MRRVLGWVGQVALVALLAGACSSGDGERVVAQDGEGATAEAPALVACSDDGPGFPASAFDGPADVEAQDGPVADGLRTLLGEGSPDTEGLPATGWRALAEDDDRVLLGAGEPPTLAYVVLEPEGDGWARSGWGECTTRPFREGLSAATWEPAAEPDADGTEVEVLVTESGCASGQEPGDRLQPAEVVEDDARVTVTFWVEPAAGGQDCQGNPSVPVTVALDGPLGDRALIDGGAFPGRVVRPGTGSEPTTTTPLPPVSPSLPAGSTSVPAEAPAGPTEGPAPTAEDPAGPPPADEDAARAAVDAAFHTAFDAHVPEQERFAAVEDGPALAEAGREAAARFPEAAGSISVTVHEVVFLDATRARVTFELVYDDALPLGPQTGEALLVDGSWKVGRETRCAIIRQAGVACP